MITKLGLLLVCLSAAATAGAQMVEVIEPAELAADGGEVAIVEFGPMTVAYTEHTGTYTGIGKAIGTLMAQVKKQKIDATGSVMAIYYNSPNDVPEKELRWDVAVEVPEGTEAAAPLMVRTIEPSPVAQLAFRGTPKELTTAYGRLMAAVGQSGHEPVGPAIEIYNAMPTSRIIDCTITFILGAPEGEGHEPPGIGAEIVIPEPMLLVFTEHTGSYAQIGPATEAFFAELAAQGIEPAGPLMHVFLNDPAETPEEGLVWHVAVPIEGEREVAEPLMLRGVPERIVARTAFVGPPEAIGETYHALAEYAMRRGYLPVGPAIATYPPHPEEPMPEEMMEDPVEGMGPPEGPPHETILMFVLKRMPRVESEIVIMGPHPQVVMANEGPFEGLNEATDAFMAELAEQGIEPAGPCTRVFHTEPEPGPYAELCVPIEGEREVGEPLQMRIFPECACARAYYEGPKAGVRTAHGIMVRQMAERGWRPAGPLMQTIFEAGEDHVACMLRFVVAKMEGEPEHPEPIDEGDTQIRVIRPGSFRIQGESADVDITD